jgi:hypothetical protein
LYAFGSSKIFNASPPKISFEIAFTRSPSDCSAKPFITGQAERDRANKAASIEL